MSPPRDASSNFLWPPTIYGSAALLALAAGWFAPLPFVPAWLAGSVDPENPVVSKPESMANAGFPAWGGPGRRRLRQICERTKNRR